MNSVVQTMNEALKDYQENLYIKFEPKYTFTVDFKGNLCFAYEPLCKVKDLTLISHVVSVPYIIFHFDKNRFIRLDMIWPEDKDPFINSFSFGYIQKDYDFDEIKEVLEEIK